jgi:hypothetical protein
MIMQKRISIIMAIISPYYYECSTRLESFSYFCMILYPFISQKH